LYKYTIFFWFF